MTGGELLYSLKDLNRDIHKKLDMLDELKATVIGITASSDKEAVQGNGDKDKLGAMMSKIVDLENEINSRVDDYAKRREVAKDIIFKIANENQQNVLYDFFICHLKLYAIAENYDMTYDNCKKCHKRAIKKFEEIYDTTFCR